MATNTGAISSLNVGLASAFSGLIADHSAGLVSCYSQLSTKLATASDGTTHSVLEAVLYDLKHHTNTVNP